MSTVIIDVDDLAVNMLPSAQRLPGFEAMAGAMLSPIHRAEELLKRKIYGSDDLDYWRAATTYSAGAIVKDISGVYESQVDGNLNNALSTPSWLKVLDSFIGSAELAKCGNKHMQLEYYLNHVFAVEMEKSGLPGYMQPTAYVDGSSTGIWATPTSSLYITTDKPAYVSRAIGTMPQDLGRLGSAATTAGAATAAIITTATSFRFTIHIPVAMFDLLGADDAIRTSVVRSFTDPRIATGLDYSIVTY